MSQSSIRVSVNASTVASAVEVSDTTPLGTRSLSWDGFVVREFVQLNEVQSKLALALDEDVRVSGNWL